MRIVTWLLIAAAIAPAARAADGDLDPAFGIGGIVEIAWPAGYARANAVGLDGNHRIVIGGSAIGAAGDADFAVFRLLPDGSQDLSYAADAAGFRLVDFNLAGIGGASDDTVRDIVVAGDGSATAAGEAHFGYAGVNSQFALARFDTNGDLDAAFGDGGSAHFGFGTFQDIDAAQALVVDAQGRSVIVGSSVNNPTYEYWFAAARLTPQGLLDPAFPLVDSYYWSSPPEHSKYNLAQAVTLDSLANIVFAGDTYNPNPPQAALARLTPDGQFDLTFGDRARVLLPLASSAASALYPLANGELMVAGFSLPSNQEQIFLARLNQDGSVDTSFGNGGFGAISLGGDYPIPYLIAPLRRGGWLVAGEVSDTINPKGVFLARFSADGQPDGGFGMGGAVTVDVSDGRHFSASRATEQPDGKLVVAGALQDFGPDRTWHFAAMRILADYDTVFVDGFESSP